MTHFPLYQFVESPDSDAVVRHDFNPGDGVDVPATGISLGSPSRMGEPDAFNPEWRFRQIQLTQRVRKFPAEALAVLSTLERECLRRSNWLRIQQTEMTPPVYAKTYASPIGATPFDKVYSSSDDAAHTFEVPVTLDADPWLLGAEETFTATILTTVAGTANEQQVVLPTIGGDFQTPVALSFDGGLGDSFVSIAPQYDTTRTRWTTTAEEAASSALATAPSAIAPGRYKVLAYQAAGVPLRFGWAPNNVLADTVWNDISATKLITDMVQYAPAGKWQDLGEVEFAGLIGGTATMTPKIHVQRTTGTGSISVVLVLVTISDKRIEEDSRAIEITTSANSIGSLLYIGENRQQAVLTSIGGDYFRTGVDPRGASQLLLHPQYEHVMTLLAATSGSSSTVTGTFRRRFRSLPSV